MILYLSGSNYGGETFRKLGVKHINRMLTFHDSYERQDGIEPEFLEILRERGGEYTPRKIRKRKHRKNRPILVPQTKKWSSRRKTSRRNLFGEKSL